MKTSVIMPAYKASAYIAQALRSALDELAPGDEVIVVDDASPDDIQAIVEQVDDPRIRYRRLPRNGGAAAARNAGLAMARGDLIQFLDDDDLWVPGRQAVVLDLMAAPSVAVVSGWVEHFLSPDMPPEARQRYVLPPPQAAVLGGSTAIRRELLERVGDFDTGLVSGEFIDLASRLMATQAGWARSDALFLRRRIHGGNHTLSTSGHSAAYLAVVRAHLQRQRGLA